MNFNPRAIDDLDAIAHHIRASSSPMVAQRWFNSIIDSLASLRQLPTPCPIAPESVDLGREVRVLLHGRRNRRYKIYFAIDHQTHSTGTVHILHVRHWARHSITRDELEDAFLA